MIWRSPEPRFDVASGLSHGGRDYQEDAVIADFPFGQDSGVAVLADGMGGHAAGDVASNIVVTQVFGELKSRASEMSAFEDRVTACLSESTRKANAAIGRHIARYPNTKGMGATLVALVLVGNRLFWTSVGDSPLYLFRDGEITQLNEDHSLSPQIDFMAEQGLISKTAALFHPDRNCLTSAISGDDIEKIDCPKAPFDLRADDILLMSSDGIDYLGQSQITKILRRNKRRNASDIANQLLKAIHDLADPDQDNVSFSVIKVNHTKPITPKPVPFVHNIFRDDDPEPAPTDLQEGAQLIPKIVFKSRHRAEIENAICEKNAQMIATSPPLDLSAANKTEPIAVFKSRYRDGSVLH